ncbi:tyrosine-type recombinase/integrase [Acidiphilium sp.]|uniref:tyrosine-type recombinase/integrase n=1 Tax=Acidiphilium sp. TaxID=527 RepID=UPI00258AAA48|nr:tyrosine-type recombinase/integrase [Acidiphilium sp.]
MVIRRSKLDRRVSKILEASAGADHAPGWSFTIQCPHEGDLAFDFNRYRQCGREDLASHMRDAFWSMRHERVGRSLLSYQTHGLNYFWEFLDHLKAAGEPVTRLEQIDRDLLGRYLAWLDMRLSTRGPSRGQPLSFAAKRVCFMHLKTLLMNRLRLAPGSVSRELSFPYNPYPHTNRHIPRRESYSPTEHKVIIAALNRDLRTIREGAGEILPELQVLVVHMLVLALATGWNLQSLLELRRDSLRDHPNPGRKLFVITKRRANAIQAMSVRDEASPGNSVGRMTEVPPSVADHFRFLCDFTAPAVADADERDRGLAFLWRVPKRANKGLVVRLNTTRVSNALRDFRQRHDLRDDRGGALRLGFARLRPTMASELYRRTRDIRQVQRALGHASPHTTAQHYVDKAPEAERDHAIVLDHMFKVLTRLEVDGKAMIAADGKMPDSEVRNLLSGGYNTGIARCRNPFRDGDAICQKYLMCFRCPNFCVFEDDLWRLFSFYERLLTERVKINPAHWMKTYGPIVRRIDAEIAPLFPSEKVEAARRQARDRPHPAWKGI